MDKKQLRIDSPCTVDWASMTRADKGRFCADCKKVVHDLSSMTERQAQALLAEPRTAEMCVRFVYDREGKVFFQPPPLLSPGLLVRAKRAVIIAAAVASQGCQNGMFGDTEMGMMGTGDYQPPPPPVLDEDAGTDAAPDAAAPDAAPSEDAGEQDAGEDAEFPHT